GLDMIIEEADQDGDVFYDSTEYAPGEYEASSRNSLKKQLDLNQVEINILVKANTKRL
ncbi:hypothetical protein CU097_002479, partial [Rhizopus azygosporus]